MLLKGTARYFLRVILYGVPPLIVVGLALFVREMNARPDLDAWHTATLDGDFRAEDSARISGLAAYRRLEDELFRQLESEVYDQAGGPPSRFNRFHRGSLVDPGRFSQNWNRTFELSVDNPRAGFLMLHGLSDSPYSWRAVAERLQAEGHLVIGLRLPGHGTAPAGLTDVDWQDFAAAVRIAAKDLARRLGPDRPLYLAGYSNGAALAVQYVLSMLEGEELPRPAGLILISPAIAVSPTAAFASWNVLLSRLPGLEKLAWLSIQPEYDPFKYNSFAVNAGDQVYRLTRDIAERVARLDRAGGGIAGFPPVLAFLSVVDATVRAEAVVDSLLVHLAPNGHKLVLFDINRESDTSTLFARDPHQSVSALLSMQVPFDLEILTNRSPETLELMVLHKSATSMADAVDRTDVALAWPEEIYSLSHVALPFRRDDPAYGDKAARDGRKFTLGSIDVRGELAVLQVPLQQFLRLRYNPFYDFLEHRILEHIENTSRESPAKPSH